jgi:hypothetical protein
MNFLKDGEFYSSAGNGHKLIVKKVWPFDYAWHCMKCGHYGRVQISKMKDLNKALEDSHEDAY